MCPTFHIENGHGMNYWLMAEVDLGRSPTLPACPGAEDIDAFEHPSLLKTHQGASLGSSDFELSFSSERSICCAVSCARVSSPHLPLRQYINRPLLPSPTAIILTVDLSTWPKLSGQTTFQMLPTLLYRLNGRHVTEVKSDPA